MSGPRVFLDACVLYPPLMRTLVIGAAEAGLFEPFWSARVLDEWRIAIAAKQGPEAAARADAAAEGLAARFPESRVETAPEREAALARLMRDPADAHVLAAAAGAGADILLTFNLRDFPARLLAGEGLAARHPDGFLWELWSDHPETLAALVRAALPGEDPSGLRRALKRARLPRLGKALEAAA
jgi:predicted nucleic acid-binding protein